jgi:hypothetical protein
VGIAVVLEPGRLRLAKQVSQDTMETHRGTHIDLDLAFHGIPSSGSLREDTGDLGELKTIYVDLATLILGSASSQKRSDYRTPGCVRRLGGESRAAACTAYTCSLMVLHKFGAR